MVPCSILDAQDVGKSSLVQMLSLSATVLSESGRALDGAGKMRLDVRERNALYGSVWPCLICTIRLRKDERVLIRTLSVLVKTEQSTVID